MNTQVFLRDIYAKIFTPVREKAIVEILKNTGDDGINKTLKNDDPNSHRVKYGASLNVPFNLDEHLKNACNRGILPFIPVELKSKNYPLVEYHYENLCIIQFKKTPGVTHCPVDSNMRILRTECSRQRLLFPEESENFDDASEKLFMLATYGLSNFQVTFAAIGFPDAYNRGQWVYYNDISRYIKSDYMDDVSPIQTSPEPQPFVKVQQQKVSDF
jgi:hypothetical protein